MLAAFRNGYHNAGCYAAWSVALCFGNALLAQSVDDHKWRTTCAPAHNSDDETADALRGGADLRVWEPVPSVIRADGVDVFRLEVTTEVFMTSVSLSDISTFLVPPEKEPVRLRDDGQGEDRFAGDLVYTSGLFRYNTGVALPAFFARDPTSPAGLFQSTIGTVHMTDGAGATSEFLLAPSVGFLDPSISLAGYVRLDEDLQVAPHLINVRVDQRHVQQALRLINDAMASVVQRIYKSVPDTFDFFTFFSIDKVEWIPSDAPENFFAGRHIRVQTGFTGTELALMNASAVYASGGVLRGINLLDGYSRGTTTANATHELLHHWAAYVPDSLLSQDGHYRAQSSAASLVGGFRWIDNLDGTYTRDCDVGRNGAFQASPIDLYFMGFVAADEVGTLWLSDPAEPLRCGEVIVDPVIPVPVDSITAQYGERTPLPNQSQRDFRVAFTVASLDRLLNPTELTFYDMLAEHYAAPVTTGMPDPFVGGNWVSIDRFFGAAARWRTDVPMLLDGDADGDVDLLEYGSLWGCFGGPDEQSPVECKQWDRNGDEHVDLADVARFLPFFTGPTWH